MKMPLCSIRAEGYPHMLQTRLERATHGLGDLKPRP